MCFDGNFYEIDNVVKWLLFYDEDFILFCDRYLIEGWYGFKIYVMFMLLLLFGKCGILYLVWLKGRLILKLNYEYRNYIKSFCVFIIVFVKNGKKKNN